VAASRVIGAALAYLVALSAFTLLLYSVGLLFLPSSARGTFALLAVGVAEAVAFAAVLLMWRYVDGRRLADLGLQRVKAFTRWLTGAAVAVLMMGFVVLVGYMLVGGATVAVNDDPLRAASVLIAGLLGYVVQGSAEEVLFRGYILANLRAHWGLPLAVGVSSVAFGLFHAPNPAFGLLPFINLTLFGVATAMYRVRFDDDQLWGVFGIHAVWNWLQQVVFGLPNSGMASLPENALFSVRPNTALPDVLTGGGFGPEGTLTATLVLAALIWATVRSPRSPRR
jgi:uncharacterized protein